MVFATGNLRGERRKGKKFENEKLPRGQSERVCEIERVSMQVRSDEAAKFEKLQELQFYLKFYLILPLSKILSEITENCDNWCRNIWNQHCSSSKTSWI